MLPLCRFRLDGVRSMLPMPVGFAPFVNRPVELFSPPPKRSNLIAMLFGIPA
jgi:hypothetical protein